MKLSRALTIGVPVLSATLLAAAPTLAQTLSMWVRESAADPGKLMVDLWNSTHDAKIELTAIPDNQLVTKLATSVRAGDAPDLVSFDLIYMPDFMRAGFLTDLTDQLAADPNYEHHIQAYKDIATYEDTHLRRRLHARRVDPRLEQGAVPPGRARPRGAAEVDLRDPRDGDQDRRLRRRHLRLLLRRLLPGLQHLRHLAADGGGRRQDPAAQRRGRRARGRGRADGARRVPADVGGGADPRERRGRRRRELRRRLHQRQRRHRRHRRLPALADAAAVPGLRLRRDAAAGARARAGVGLRRRRRRGDPRGHPERGDRPGVRHLGAERRGAARRARQELDPDHPHRPRRQRVLRRQREGAGDGGRRSKPATCPGSSTSPTW